jgi:protease PrsW
MIELVRIAVSLVPVVAFLTVLMCLDSFKLVPPRRLAAVAALGAVAAIVGFFVNVTLTNLLGIDLTRAQRYLAPATEEVLKAATVMALIRSHRVGFLVDTAVCGFAVGTGFALVENVYYLRTIEHASIFMWVVRGFGTGILHGSTTAVFAMVSKSMADRLDSVGIRVFLPGLLAAILIHSIFNHIPIHPILMTIVILISMPALVVLVFARSEVATRTWLGDCFDADVELLELISSGEISGSRIGRYLTALKDRFPGTVVADMLCLVQIQLELSLRAKGMLMAREAGIRVSADERVRANFEELRYLERSIGPTGRLAIMPLLRRGSRELWQLYMLGES